MYVDVGPMLFLFDRSDEFTFIPKSINVVMTNDIMTIFFILSVFRLIPVIIDFDDKEIKVQQITGPNKD